MACFRFGSKTFVNKSALLVFFLSFKLKTSWKTYVLVSPLETAFLKALFFTGILVLFHACVVVHLLQTTSSEN